jgi:hypothetical protein
MTAFAIGYAAARAEEPASRTSMHIELKAEGGIAHFPGLSKPAVIDTGQLPAEEAGQLENLVRAARFFDLPPMVGSPHPGAADFRKYTITIEDGPHQNSVQIVTPVESGDVRRLLDYLRAKTHR